jgi:hypothetical protein
MREPTLLVMTLLLALVGCQHDTPEAIHQKQAEAAGRGRDKFSEELVQKNLTWYVPAGSNFTGFDRNSGLPEQLITGSGVVDPYTADFIRGHNDAILQYIATNGPVPGSFKPWEAQLYHQAAYFDMHQDEQPQKLRAGGAPVKSPDGRYTLVLQPSGGTGSLITRSPFELVTITATGQHAAAPPVGASEASADVLFGPSGSDLAFTRWTAAGHPVYGALDLRDGRWLVVQAAQQ